MKLRSHQQTLKNELNRDDELTSIIAHVVPGGGKSMLPGILAQRFPQHRIAWFVPRLSLARQAALGMMKDFSIALREAGNDINPSRGTRGFVTTHAALTMQPDLWRHELSRHPHLLVIDEGHHAKVSRSGEPNALAAAIDILPFHVRLNMTGTLETNDSSFIHGIPYAEDDRGYAVNLKEMKGLVIEYPRARALAEKAIVPIEFFYHDGPVRWDVGDGIKEVALSEAATGDESAAVWTALRTEFADQLLWNCIDHWREHGDHLLVVTADQQGARKYHAALRLRGIAAGLAISDSDGAHDDIEAFRNGKVRALVTCQMAYEGLDVPRISHIACLTHIRSTPWITQMMARAWRATKDKKRCWAFVPNDPRMARVIEAMRAEQIPIVPLEVDDEAERSSGGGAKGLGFVPIDGRADITSRAMLDEIPVCAESEIEHSISSIANQYNLPLDHPELVRLGNTLRAEMSRAKPTTAPEAPLQTVTDQEWKIRTEITKTCARADNFKGLPFGTHQKRLWSRTGKSTTEMTVKELEHARSICAQLCA